MGLDFGGTNMFNQMEEDGTFARKNIQINREDVQPILQNQGDMVLWERGNGFVYDAYNSVIDATKWAISVSGSGVLPTETDAYIEMKINPALGGSYVETKLLPALADMSQIFFRLIRVTGGSGSNLMKIVWFGNDIDPIINGGVSVDNEWTGIKAIDGTWNIYKDDVFFANITPTDNILKIYSVARNTSYARLYPVSVGGGTFLLIKSTQGTFKIDLASF